MNNHSKSNRFFLSVAGICIGLSIASVQPRFKGQRIAIFTLGLISSQVVLSRCKNVQSQWEKNATAQWEEIQQAKQKVVDAEIELKEREQREQSKVESERVSLTRECELLSSEAQSLERELLARQDAANAELQRKYAEFERLKAEANATLERMQSEANADLDRKKQAILTDVGAQASKEIEQARAGYQKALEQAKSELETAQKDAALWRHRYEQLDKPRLPRRRENMAERYCEDYIFALWRHEVKRDTQTIKVGNSTVKFSETIKTDCDDRQPIDVATHYAFWLKLRNPEHFQLLKTDAVREKLAISVKTPVPYFVIEGSEGVIRCEIPQKPGYIIPKEYRNTEREKNLKLYDITELEAKRGFLITGHPGSGKTSVMRFLGQALGGKDAQRLALTPHEEDAASFQDAGFAVINDVQQIIQQIQLLDEEIKLRGKDSTRRFKLIVAIDELGRILSSAKIADIKPEDLMESVRQMAVEGRKLDVIVLVGNHSQTTSAIKMDSEFRNSFYQLFLCGAALHVESQPGKDARLNKEQEEYLHEAAYPCLALINSQFKLCKHPTHSEYLEYKDSGNPPKNIEQWEVNPITIYLTSGSQHLAKKEDRQTYFSLSEDEQVLIDWAKEKPGDFYLIKNAANRAYFAKKRKLSLTEVTGIIERLKSLGLIEVDDLTTPQRYRVRG